jgi:hypothetical protein
MLASLKNFRILFMPLLVAAPLIAQGISVANGPGKAIPYARQNARIAVVFDGKPVAGARISVGAAPFTGNPLVLTTDNAGNAVLPHLRPGQYRIHVSFAEDFDMRILRSPRAHLPGEELSDIRFDLAPDRNPYWAYLTACGQSEPASRHLQELSGVVVDPSGETIPGALVIAVPTGTQSSGYVADNEEKLPVKGSEYFADSKGRFSVSFTGGDYFVVIDAPGFKPSATHISVDAASDAGKLRIVLQSGCAFEAVSVNQNR